MLISSSKLLFRQSVLYLWKVALFILCSNAQSEYYSFILTYVSELIGINYKAMVYTL